ncbi:MAG: hypothetical protein RLZZ299_1307 [Pseudomonadota bacterium]
MLELAKRLWIAWNGVARRLLAAQNAAAMGVAWVLGIAPTAIVMRLIGHDPLDRRPPRPDDVSHWTPRDDGPLTMERARRPF